MSNRPTCACGRPVADQARLCAGCTERLARDLGDIGALAEEVTTTRLRQSRTGGQATGVLSRSYERPLPWDERASEAADVLRSTVVAWVRIVVEERGATCPTDDMADMGRTLLASLEWLRHHEAADEAADEIGHAVRHVRRVIDLAPEKVFFGPCNSVEYIDGNPDPSCDPCPADLYGREGVSAVVCGQCQTQHDVGDIRGRLYDAAQDRLATAAEMSRFLTYFGQVVNDKPLTAARIRKWASRRTEEKPPVLLAHAHDKDGRPLYRVGDVVALLEKGLKRAS